MVQCQQEALFLSSVNFVTRLPLSQIQCLSNQMFSYLKHHLTTFRSRVNNWASSCCVWTAGVQLLGLDVPMSHCGHDCSVGTSLSDFSSYELCLALHDGDKRINWRKWILVKIQPARYFFGCGCGAFLVWFFLLLLVFWFFFLKT